MAREDLVRLVFTVAACAALACLGTCLRREGSHRVTLLQYAPSVEDNFRNAGLLTLQDNWEQRGGGLTRRAADLDVFPTRFGEPTDVAAKSKTQQLAKVADSGQEIVGDAARVDQTGQGELIWTSDGTPVQPTPWHIQFGGGGSPDWIVRSRQEQLAEPRRTSAGGDEVTTFSDEEEDKIASAISRWIETASGGKKMGEDGNVGEAEAERPSGKRSLSHRSMKKRHASRGSDPQQKHMWQPWATKTDDLKARAAGKLWKKVWELQRKNLKNMARMCPMCSAIPGPTELKRIFCEACKQFPTTWGDKLINGKPGARGEPLSGSPPNYLNDDSRPLHHTPMDKGTWWGDNDAWYDGWEQHRTDLWPPYQARYVDEKTGKLINGGGWKAMADDLNRGGNDYPEYKRTGMAPEYWERPGNEHDLDRAGKVSHAEAAEQGEQFLDSNNGEITGATSFSRDWEKLRPEDKLPPWCDRILGCPPPYNAKGEQDAGRSETDKTTWSWPYNENGKKIQLVGSERSGGRLEGRGRSGRGLERREKARRLQRQAHGLLKEAKGLKAVRAGGQAEVALMEAQVAALGAGERRIDVGSTGGTGDVSVTDVALFPPWRVSGDDPERVGLEENGNYPGFRSGELTGVGLRTGSKQDGALVHRDDFAEEEEGGEEETGKEDDADWLSARDRAALRAGRVLHAGWAGPVGGADRIVSVLGRREQTKGRKGTGSDDERRGGKRTLSQRSLASELHEFVDATVGR